MTSIILSHKLPSRYHPKNPEQWRALARLHAELDHLDSDGR